MKTAHTPGPIMSWGTDWRIDIYSENGDVIAYVLGKTQELCEANAKLIAAAPDLLAALEKISMWYTCPPAVRPAFPFETLEAIKKATE